MRHTQPDHAILSVSNSMRSRLRAICLLCALAIFPAAAHAQDVDLLEVLINAVTLGQKFAVEERSSDRELRISAVGSVVFNETDDDVLRLDGRLTIREKRAGVTRQIEFRQRDGMLRRTYKLNGREVELDADAKRWVAGIIKSTIREQAMDATRRIKRIHAKSGATGGTDAAAAATPGTIQFPAQPLPKGLRAGQTLVVNAGGSVPLNFNAAPGSRVEVRGGSLGGNFEAVGAEMLQPACGACANCGPGSSSQAEQVTVSAINRNFPGRSGPGSVWLASPATVAASAIAGRLQSFAELQEQVRR